MELATAVERTTCDMMDEQLLGTKIPVPLGVRLHMSHFLLLLLLMLYLYSCARSLLP